MDNPTQGAAGNADAAVVKFRVPMPLKLDTEEYVFFYEQDHYYLSNFSAFRLSWRGKPFDTSEHAYQWAKFDHAIGTTAEAISAKVRGQILHADSAHEAFKIGTDPNNKCLRLLNWDAIKFNVMHNILVKKVEQHVAYAIQAGALRENPESGPDGVGVQTDHAYTLEARAEVQAVVFQPRFARNDRGAPDTIASALTAEAGRTGKGDSAQCVAYDNNGWAVRRLMTIECAKLQGFDPHHAQIAWRGRPAEECPDGPQYKVYGNSMAVNNMRWLGERIAKAMP